MIKADKYYDDIYWGYANNFEEYSEFLLELWNTRDYLKTNDFSFKVTNYFKDDYSAFFKTVKASFKDDNKEEYPNPTDTNTYTINKRPKEKEYPVIILYSVLEKSTNVGEFE